MSRSSNIFAGKTPNKPKFGPALDADGREIEFDVREDEEQNVKYTETIELLLAAGYFRARIKGLSPFDKVVGGMTWCITTCNIDVDVDLLFQENSTIGQKIALTEKIVAALPKMKCPHRIEPHQIQGLDFIHIFPVVQICTSIPSVPPNIVMQNYLDNQSIMTQVLVVKWLVKRAIETKEEMGDYIRAYSISQFNKYHSLPQDKKFDEEKDTAVSSIKTVKDVYAPQRKFKRSNSLRSQDEETRVHSTLLEYGRKYGLNRNKQSQDEKNKNKSLGSQFSKEEESEESRQEEEERKIQALMTGMSAMGSSDGKLTASAVGSIVGMKSEEIQQIASQYANKQSELDKMEKNERMGGAQHHKRLVASIQKQIQLQKKTLLEVKEKHELLDKNYQEAQEKLKEAEDLSLRIDGEMEKLVDMETEENQGVLQTLRSLVAMNESLKKQEKDFKAHCKEEMARLQDSIKRLQSESGLDDNEDQERAGLIDKQYLSDKEKLHKIRLLLARKNREISALQRKIDEVPTRAELSQYQRRFVELYNQIAAKHKETKQFYTLYNTLDDTKLYLNKEVNLLNSIHDNFEQAMSSNSNKEQFLKQFEQIVEGIKQNRSKVERKKQEEKMRRDQLNDEFLDLIEKQRLYFKTVKDFKEECRKNEILSAKLQGK